MSVCPETLQMLMSHFVVTELEKLIHGWHCERVDSQDWLALMTHTNCQSIMWWNASLLILHAASFMFLGHLQSCDLHMDHFIASMQTCIDSDTHMQHRKALNKWPHSCMEHRNISIYKSFCRLLNGEFAWMAHKVWAELNRLTWTREQEGWNCLCNSQNSPRIL